MFEWSDARYFLAVHRTHSLSAAGRELKVNQSTVGRRLHALEEALGMRLFVQTPDGYFLAPGGERFLPHAERMESDALAVEREASGQEARLTGLVRLTGPDAFSVRLLAPLMTAFHERAPDITLELIAENRTFSLSKREADLAIRTVRSSESSLIVRRICGLASALYASEAYLAARGRPGADYRGHSFLGFDDPSYAEAKWFERKGGKARMVLRTNSTLALLGATLDGVGLCLLPCYLGDPEPRLVRVLPPEKVFVRGVWLVLHKDLQHAARIRACADFLIEGIGARAAQLEGTLPR